MKKEESRAEERLENVETALNKTPVWFEKNQGFVYGAIIVVLGLALVIMGLRALNAKRERSAQDEKLTAEKYFLAAIKTDNKKLYEDALEGDGNYLGFTEIYHSYKRTKTGKFAAYCAGICYKHLDKNEEAIEYLKKSDLDDDLFASFALGVIGDCYMDLDQYGEAAAYYEKAANKSLEGFAPMFLQKAAMTYEIMGNNAQAIKCYEKLKSDYPLSNEAFEVGKNIAKMEEMMK